MEKKKVNIKQYAEVIGGLMNDTANLDDGDERAFDDFDAKSVYFVLLRNLIFKAQEETDKSGKV